jgi:hypothetical protein
MPCFLETGRLSAINFSDEKLPHSIRNRSRGMTLLKTMCCDTNFH